jgi:formylmethanofuran dehydrogenase subunit C
LIKLRPTKTFKFPIIAECISPDLFQDRKTSEIADLEAWEGNKQTKLSDLFKIED